MPGFIKPQLATLRSKAPKNGYLHEIKYDGYRVQLHLNKGKAKAYTRNGLDWTRRFSLIAGAFDIPGHAIIDGEVVVVHKGRTNFGELQAELARGDQDRLLYYAFDLLWRDGQDLRKRPQVERKALLKELFDSYELEPPVLFWVFYSRNDCGVKMLLLRIAVERSGRNLNADCSRLIRRAG